MYYYANCSTQGLEAQGDFVIMQRTDSFEIAPDKRSLCQETKLEAQFCRLSRMAPRVGFEPTDRVSLYCLLTRFHRSCCQTQKASVNDS